MSCDNCEGPIDWADDVPDICEHCYNRMLAESSRFEPGDDPKPAELLPSPDSCAIDRNRVNMANSKRLLSNMLGVIDHVRDSARDGEVTEADLLHAMEHLIRMFAAQQIGERVLVNPTAAVTNRVTIVHSLQTLINELQALQLPNPVVN